MPRRTDDGAFTAAQEALINVSVKAVATSAAFERACAVGWLPSARAALWAALSAQSAAVGALRQVVTAENN